MPLAAAAQEICRWYQARGLPAMVAVPFPLRRSQSNGLDRFLNEHGWHVRAGSATVMTAAAGAVARLAAAGQARVEVTSEPDDDWLALYHYRGQEPPPIARRLLMSAPWQAFACVRDAGDTLAIGRVAVAEGWAGLTAVEVHPQHRRRGLARAITATLAAVAAGQGVASLYLQVEDGNTPARTLYSSAGFADHHSYHYRIAPATAARPRSR